MNVIPLVAEAIEGFWPAVVNTVSYTERSLPYSITFIAKYPARIWRYHSVVIQK